MGKSGNKNKNMQNSNSNEIVTVVTYDDVGAQMKAILKENRGKAAVYRWINKVNGKEYVGSSVNLRRRLSTYFSHKYLSSNKFIISKALLKYGYAGFRLEIIEYCLPQNVIQREQYYIDLLKPEYNILKVAGSMLGFKHSESTRERLSNLYTGRKISEQVREKMSESQKGRVHTLEAKAKMRISKIGLKLSEEHKTNLRAAALGKKHDESTKLKISGSKGTTVIVHNIKTGEIQNFVSMREASRHFNISDHTIARYIKFGTIYKDKYKISKLA